MDTIGKEGTPSFDRLTMVVGNELSYAAPSMKTVSPSDTMLNAEENELPRLIVFGGSPARSICKRLTNGSLSQQALLPHGASAMAPSGRPVASVVSVPASPTPRGRLFTSSAVESKRRCPEIPIANGLSEVSNVGCVPGESVLARAASTPFSEG